MNQAEQLDFDMLFDSAIPRRDSSVSQYSKRLSIASDSWPSTPLLPHTPTAYKFPRSSSGQSIPIFFDADDVAEGDEGGKQGQTRRDSSCRDKHNPFEGEHGFVASGTSLQRPLHDFEMNRTSTYSSASSSRCLSIDSSSAASVSTAPTEPPSPGPLTPTELDCPPPVFANPFPLPLPLDVTESSAPRARSQSHHPLLNARRNVPSRPGTAPSPPRLRSFSSSPASTLPHASPRPQNSHLCLKRRAPPRTADSTSSPPRDAFYDPSLSSSRPSTTSTFAGSVKLIPIRLVPPTPTPSDRAVRTRHRELYRAPSSPLLTTKEARSKPLPSLPIFPTRPATSTPTVPTRRRTPPTTAAPPSHARNRSRSEGVYNVPFYPPCIYPPSPPRPTQTSPRPSPRAKLASKFSYRHLLRDGSEDSELESIPLISRGGRKRKESKSTAPASLVEFESADEGAKFVVGESSLQLLIDQEGFRDAKVEFVYMGEDAETGLLEFVARRPEAGLEREGWPFHVGFLQTPPQLRRLHLNGDDSLDYLRREASLSIGNKDGVYKVSSHSKIDLDLAHGGKDIEGPYFSFAYETKRRLNLVGRPMKGERLLRPLVFVCSREFLNPSQGRKIGFMHLIARTFTIPTSASLVVRKQKSISTLKLGGERERRS